jgi:hypothetical protein
MPFNRKLYPPDWEEISKRVKDEAGWACEGSPAYPDCRARHGEPHPVTGSRVVLTTAHLDHDPANCERSNLRAWCQRCHNTYDFSRRRANAAARRRAEKAAELAKVQPSLFTKDGEP